MDLAEFTLFLAGDVDRHSLYGPSPLNRRGFWRAADGTPVPVPIIFTASAGTGSSAPTSSPPSDAAIGLECFWNTMFYINMVRPDATGVSNGTGIPAWRLTMRTKQRIENVLEAWYAAFIAKGDLTACDRATIFASVSHMPVG